MEFIKDGIDSFILARELKGRGGAKRKKNYKNNFER
jgi:hypothetical protein